MAVTLFILVWLRHNACFYFMREVSVKCNQFTAWAHTLLLLWKLEPISMLLRKLNLRSINPSNQLLFIMHMY